MSVREGDPQVMSEAVAAVAAASWAPIAVLTTLPFALVPALHLPSAGVVAFAGDHHSVASCGAHDEGT